MKKLLLILGTISIMIGCSNQPKEPTKAKTAFCIPDSLLNQVKTDTVTYKPATSELKLIGKVTFDQDKVVRIYPLVSGNVTEVKVSLGSYVNKGDILAIIKSSEMASAENDFVSAKSNLAVTQKNFESSSDMYKSGILSEKEFIASQKELDKAKSEMERANTVLSIYGSGAQSDYVVKSPTAGFIVEKFINPNMQIRPDNNQNLFTISNLRNVWVMANVYESNIAAMKENEKVEISTISYPDKRFYGKIDKIYNVLDPDTKTMKVQIKLDNSDYLLKPEMFATVLVQQLVPGGNMLAIPTDAVIFDKNKYWVLVYKDKCNIQTRKLDIVSSNSKYTYVNSGVKRGEKVIVTRQLLIYDAMNQ